MCSNIFLNSFLRHKAKKLIFNFFMYSSNRAEVAQNFLPVVSWLGQSVFTDASPSPQTYAHRIYFFHPKSFRHCGVLGEVSGWNLAGWNQVSSFAFVFM